MAISFTVSYTFAPNTTISSSQVNTNTSDVSNVFTGLEALTKTFAKLKVDVDPSTALEVATKQYVDHYAAYRRPALTYQSTTTVQPETGTAGVTGSVSILFPDGSLRSDSTSAHVLLDVTRVATLTSSGQSGLRTGTVANNTWYAVYAVKMTDNSTNLIIVADTVLPTAANFTTLNSNFGTSGWVYLGMIRYGDQGATANVILRFAQCGNRTLFGNVGTGNNVGAAAFGILLATTAGATTLTYSIASGTAGAVIPTHITLVLHTVATAAVNSIINVQDSAAGAYFALINSALTTTLQRFETTLLGVKLSNGTATSIAYDIWLSGFVDPVLGVGSNPQI